MNLFLTALAVIGLTVSMAYGGNDNRKNCHPSQGYNENSNSQCDSKTPGVDNNGNTTRDSDAGPGPSYPGQQ